MHIFIIEGLIAYVPQNILCPNNITVLEYVKKENKNIIDDDVRLWLERFHMQDISFETLIKSLSGGKEQNYVLSQPY